MSDATKSFLKSCLKFLFAGGIVAWLILTGRFDIQSALAIFRSPSLLLAGLLLLGISLFLASERWRLLATPHEVSASPWEVFRLTLIGTFFNYAMPGGVGGDLVKAYYFSKDHPHARAAAITSVFLDRLLGLYAMIALALAVMLINEHQVFSLSSLRMLFALLAGLFLAFSIGFYVLFSRRLKATGHVDTLLAKLPLSRKLTKLYETGHRFGLLRRRVVAVLLLSLCAQAASLVFLWVAGIAAGFHDVPLGIYFLVGPLGYMATAIPISPAGIGVGQAAFFFLFNTYLGTESGLGPAVITSQQAVTALFGLLGAYFYVRRGEKLPSTGLATEDS